MTQRVYIMTTVTCMVAASLKQFSKQRYKLVNNCLQPFHIITSRASAQRRWLQTLQTRNMTENELNVQHDREKCEFFIQIKKGLFLNINLLVLLIRMFILHLECIL